MTLGPIIGPTDAEYALHHIFTHAYYIAHIKALNIVLLEIGQSMLYNFSLEFLHHSSPQRGVCVRAGYSSVKHRIV